MARRPALGNDPFVRGAPAVEAEEAAPKASAPTPPPAPRPPLRAKRVGARPPTRTTASAVSTLAPVAKSQDRLVPVARDVDDFGLARGFVDRWQPRLAWLLQNYFRMTVSGAERIPASGPAMIVCNHSGLFPYDELLLKAAVTWAHPDHRSIRPLSEDFAIHLPFAGVWLNRFGCVRACPENAERLLASGEVVAVFPEGGQGIGRLYRDRYRLGRFGRGGFVKLALRAQVPIIPAALVGADDAHPILARIALPPRLGLPTLPLTPTFPWLGPLGLVPLPSRWALRVGEPVQPEADPSAAEDRPRVARLADDIRTRVQTLLDEALTARPDPYL
jgi:1-acyl-sn-glycerol-3-phosphate acyltransferase